MRSAIYLPPERGYTRRMVIESWFIAAVSVALIIFSAWQIDTIKSKQRGYDHAGIEQKR